KPPTGPRLPECSASTGAASSSECRRRLSSSRHRGRQRTFLVAYSVPFLARAGSHAHATVRADGRRQICPSLLRRFLLGGPRAQIKRRAVGWNNCPFANSLTICGHKGETRRPRATRQRNDLCESGSPNPLPHSPSRDGRLST